jgi:phenylalanyl-tRNA synthetase beta chain
LERVELVGIFRSDKLGAGKKNMTLRFHYRALEKTLSQEEVDSQHKSVLAAVCEKLGAALLDANQIITAR